MIFSRLCAWPHGLHGRALARGCPHRLARRNLLLRSDHRPLLDPGRDSLLDRAVRSLPVLQGIEARLLRLVERKVELCVAVEAVEREPRARVPIAVDAAEIAAELRQLDEHVLRELLARGALGQRRLGGLFSFRRGLFGVLAFGGGDLCVVAREARHPALAMAELMRKSRLGRGRRPWLAQRHSWPARRRPRGWSCRSLRRPIAALPAPRSWFPRRASSGEPRAAPAAT